MKEISKTHKELGLPKNLFEGAADIYRLVETSPLGKEVVEDRKLGTSAKDVADIGIKACFAGKDIVVPGLANNVSSRWERIWGVKVSSGINHPPPTSCND